MPRGQGTEQPGGVHPAAVKGILLAEGGSGVGEVAGSTPARCHRQAPAPSRGDSPAKPKPDGALPNSGLSSPNSDSSPVRHPGARPGFTGSHPLGTRPWRGDAAPARAPSLNKSASATRAGCDAGSSPQQGSASPLRERAAYDFWAFVPEHRCPGCKAHRLHPFLPQTEDDRAQGTGMPRTPIPSKLEPSSSITPGDLFPSHSRKGRHRLLPLLLRYFSAASGSWQEPPRAVSGPPPVAGWRKREGTVFGPCYILFQKAIADISTTLYNRTGHSALQRFQKT